ncbi:MAG: putative toxin-antitoxin system toxin component, PIN family [Verrucomicrobia bacterium]|nr:putative toxin-antitoxin system toxin component, PIN family [Verrucomicrobiota bacterium]
MNIVCDTNILVSGILFGGHARDILRQASRGNVTNFVSADILRELETVLARPKFGLHSEQTLAIIALVRDTYDYVEPDTSVDAVSDDPDDNRILEAAFCADAEYIVSGDKHLLSLKEWEGIRIVKASTFIQKVLGQHSPGE